MLDFLYELSENLRLYIGFIQFLVTVAVTLIILIIIFKAVKHFLLRKAKTKREISNITVFLDILKYTFILLLIIIIFSSYYGRWGDIGFLAGLLTVALGWALQKPISGVVAWLIIIIRRPFHIGDRIIISDIIGDVVDITLTHIFLKEVGGTIDGEEYSNRTIMIPTSIIFDQRVINYNYEDNFILDEVKVTVTYESDLIEAEKVVIEAVNTVLKTIIDKFPDHINKTPYTRLYFQDSGILINVRYYTIVAQRNKISTDIRREIYMRIRNSENIEFAYPHREILLRKSI